MQDVSGVSVNIASRFVDDAPDLCSDDKVDAKAYLTALDALPKGSAVIIFTPDDTHFEQALAAVERGHHVLVTKPIVQTLAHHAELAAAAEKHGVLVAVEVHKRWDPIYTDA